MKNFDLLEKMPLFKGIAPSDIPVVLEKLMAYTRKYRKNEFIKNAGDPADFIGIVLKGHIQVIRDDYFGNRSITGVFGPGDLFAEAFSCAGVPALPVDILSFDDSEIMFISRKSIFSGCDSRCVFHDTLISNLLTINAEKNILLTGRLRYMSCKTTSEKIMAYLSDEARRNNSPEFTIPFDRQGLADFLGVERSAMSTEIGKLVRAGRIETVRSRFKLLKT